MPPRGVKSGSKRARQYEHIKESGRRRGMSTGRAEQMAARTVNKERSESHETSRGSKKKSGGSRKSSSRGGSRKRSSGGRTSSSRKTTRKSSRKSSRKTSRKSSMKASRKSSGSRKSSRGGRSGGGRPRPSSQGEFTGAAEQAMAGEDLGPDEGDIDTGPDVI